MKKFAFKLLKILAAAAFWVFVWYLLSMKVGIELLLPTPAAVMQELFRLVGTKEFWLITSTSLLRILWGIAISLILGCLIAYLTSVSRILKTLLSPLISVVKATPIASFIILALLWIDTSILPVFITALIVIPIVSANVSEGILSVDKDLKEVTVIYKFSLFKKLFKLYIPSILPYFTAACRASLGMAWKAGIAAEILAIPENSIGKKLYLSKTGFETTSLFAWTLVVILLSIIIENIFVHLLNKLGRSLKVVPKGEGYAKN